MENGKTYLVNSSRKGAFMGRLISHCDTWATFEITAGKASAMLDYNERHKGEEVTVRREFCIFAEQPEKTLVQMWQELNPADRAMATRQIAAGLRDGGAL